MGKCQCGFAFAFLFAAIDLTVFVLALMVIYTRATMIFDIYDILSDGAQNLLALCPPWTITTVRSLEAYAYVSWGALILGTMAGTMFFLADVNFVFSVSVSGSCPNTPTRAVHSLVLFSLFSFGTMMLFTISGFTLQWKNDGHPLSRTSPRRIDSRYYETSCFGYGGCSGSYVSSVVAEHDDWCPTGKAPLLENANAFAASAMVVFGISFAILLVGLPVVCCYGCGMRARVAVVAPAAIAAVYGLVLGAIQFPLVLPWILAHALWQYARLLVNYMAGIDQGGIDKDFRVNPNSDMVPGIIGAPVSGDGGGEIDTGGYMGY